MALQARITRRGRIGCGRVGCTGILGDVLRIRPDDRVYLPVQGQRQYWLIGDVLRDPDRRWQDEARTHRFLRWKENDHREMVLWWQGENPEEERRSGLRRVLGTPGEAVEKTSRETAMGYDEDKDYKLISLLPGYVLSAGDPIGGASVWRLSSDARERQRRGERLDFRRKPRQLLRSGDQSRAARRELRPSVFVNESDRDGVQVECPLPGCGQMNLISFPLVCQVG